MWRSLRTIDVLLYLFPILLWGMGCVVLWSLTYANPESSIHNLAIKQFIFGLIGILAMLGVTLTDYRALRTSAWIAAGITLLLLLAVEFFGSTSLGATRWLEFGFFQLQPSEIAKIVLIITLGVFFTPYFERVLASVFVGALAIVIPPLYLVIKQPDLGTAIILCVIVMGMIFSLKLRRSHFTFIAASALVIAVVGTLAFANVGPFGHLLRDYQRDRITTFVDPGKDPLGKGYNVRQAVIAIGNGGLWGHGLGKEVGQLSQLNFLPKAYTDFIFAALAESLGLLGAGLLLLFFAGFLWRVIHVSSVAKDSFGILLANGFFSMIAFSVLVNAGMNMGIMPVTGVPLPFVSAGGTALIMNFVGVGMMQSIMIRRHTIQFD